MIRIPFLRSAIALAALGAPLLACGGRVVSIGSNADQLTTVAPSSVSSSVSSCPTGYQHPNICCSGGPTESSSCGAYINKPFRPCDTGSTTYPNALSCCSLSDGTCVDASSTANPPPTGPSTGVCTSACPPGWWSAEGTSPNSGASQGSNTGSGGSGTSGSDPTAPGGGPSSGPAQGVGTSVTCCRSAGNGLTECMAPTSTTGSDDLPPSAGCTVPVPSPDPTPIDAGVDDDGSTANPPGPPDAGCTATDAGTTTPSPTPPPGTCTVPCPDGWTSQSGAPDVCCRDNPDGSGECFSQSSGGWGSDPGNTTPPNPGGNPGGPTSGRDCYGTAPAGPDGGSAATCGCSSASGKIQEELHCDDATHVCTCTSGSTTSTVPYPSNAAVCAAPQSLDSLWVACGFAL